MKFLRISSLSLLPILLCFSCGTGPAPKPVTNERLRSGEEVARQAGQAASDRSQEPTVLYETSRGTLEKEPDEEPAQEIEREPASDEIVDGEPEREDEDGEIQEGRTEENEENDEKDEKDEKDEEAEEAPNGDEDEDE